MNLSNIMNKQFISILSHLSNEPTLLNLIYKHTETVVVPEAAAAFFVSAILQVTDKKPLVVVTPTQSLANQIFHDTAAFLGQESVELFPAWETLPFERVSPDFATMGQRLKVLHRLSVASPLSLSFNAVSSRDGFSGDAPFLIVTSIKALLQQLGPEEAFAESLFLSRGQVIDTDFLYAKLINWGYRREYQVEHRGELAVRGGIVDIFPSTFDVPIRVDLIGDEIDRLCEFSVDDQRSTKDIESAEIFACRELLCTPEVKERARHLSENFSWGISQWEKLREGVFFDGMESWLSWVVPEGKLMSDLLPPSAQLIFLDPLGIQARATELCRQEADLCAALAPTWDAAVDVSKGDTAQVCDSGAQGALSYPPLHKYFDEAFKDIKVGICSLMPTSLYEGTPTLEAKTLLPLDTPGTLPRFLANAKDWLSQGYRVVVCALDESSAEHMRDSFEQVGLAAVEVVNQPLMKGFVSPALKLAIACQSDIQNRYVQAKQNIARSKLSLKFFDDLEEGDYVVHRRHGIAVYSGMTTSLMNGVERDYLVLEYAFRDKLYVPADQIASIAPYAGGDSPVVNRLRGTEWSRAKSKAKEAARRIAKELVVLYSNRISSPGHAFSIESEWEKEVAESFAYQETPDQAQAIRDVLDDMSQPTPMDRLICGDVGFGKTEVAIRAAFRAVLDDKQVVVLVPTTLLAAQHFVTFRERLSHEYIKIAMLSRFVSEAHSKAVLKGIKDGTVNVVIATHKLLNEKVQFKDLGLLIIDEEQRFGVSHKEAIKMIHPGVDVLVMTANPIPRTLEMSLSGIRDLSIINTPPLNRQPILTYVGPYDEPAVAEAIRRELLREGQVLFVHNKVADIAQTAESLKELVSHARIAYAHGQMNEKTLERIVLDFRQQRYDVLVSTTIVESGIDIPSVNCLIVDEAHNLGLGQLHQLRGRVGRRGQRSYAYMFYPPGVTLKEKAYERLKTIGECTELGSGFRIAMRDLALRGAGTILGFDQSGSIAAVGYDLYVQMMTQAISELKGEKTVNGRGGRKSSEIKLDIPVNAYLPKSYIEEEDSRLEAYQRLVGVQTLSEVADVEQEWRDRYGPLPPNAATLIDIAKIRTYCIRLEISEIVITPERKFTASPLSKAAKAQVKILPIRLSAPILLRIKGLYPGSEYIKGAHKLLLKITWNSKSLISLADLFETILASQTVNTASLINTAGCRGT